MNQLSPIPTEVSNDQTARIRKIRSELPGQMLRERVETARLCYGPLYSMNEVRQKVAETLPRRVGYMRSAALEPIETYQDPIPDDALLKYDDARSSGLFSKFWVASPRYYESKQTDPWIIAEVQGTELYAVVAQWD
jgi:hypothetical protein